MNYKEEKYTFLSCWWNMLKTFLLRRFRLILNISPRKERHPTFQGLEVIHLTGLTHIPGFISICSLLNTMVFSIATSKNLRLPDREDQQNVGQLFCVHTINKLLYAKDLFRENILSLTTSLQVCPWQIIPYHSGIRKPPKCLCRSYPYLHHDPRNQWMFGI